MSNETKKIKVLATRYYSIETVVEIEVPKEMEFPEEWSLKEYLEEDETNWDIIQDALDREEIRKYEENGMMIDNETFEVN